jgi:chromosome segregation ATPase
MSEITLDVIARQIERVINDIADLKADMTVVMARVERVDTSLRRMADEMRSLSDEVRALAGQQSRQRLKLDRLEARLDTRGTASDG